jgi:hypothetical protein
MSDDDEEDMESMAWPGFVDILSSVIIMFVFFVMVVASALFFHMIIFKSKVLSEVSDSMAAISDYQELADTNRSLMKKIEEMEDNAKIAEKLLDENDIQLYQEHTQFAESKDQKITENVAEKTLTIFFGEDSISITKENMSSLIEQVQKYSGSLTSPDAKIEIISANNADSKNDIISRKLSTARMFNVRNVILQTELKDTKIIPSISSTAEKIEGTYNWVKIVFKEN